MADKMRFVIELDNGQYRVASQQVIKDTEKIEKSARKNYKGIDEAGKAFNQKMRRYFSFGALFGGLFLAGYGAFRKLFSAISDGVKRAIENNEELNNKLVGMKYAFEDLFNSIGVFLAPIIGDIADVVTKALKLKKQTDTKNTEKEKKVLTTEISGAKLVIKGQEGLLKSGLITKKEFDERVKNYKEIIIFNEYLLEKINEQQEGEKKLTRALKEKREEEKRIAEEKRKQEAIKDVVSSQEEVVKQAKAEDDIRKSIDSTLVDITSEYGNLVKLEETEGKQSQQSLSTFVAIASKVGNLVEEMKKYEMVQKEANNASKDLANSTNKNSENIKSVGTSSQTWLSIFIAIFETAQKLAAISNQNLLETSETANETKRINEQLEDYQTNMEKINVLLKRANALAGIQELSANNNTEAIKKDIAAKQDIIKQTQDQIELNNRLIESTKDISAGTAARNIANAEAEIRQLEGLASIPFLGFGAQQRINYLKGEIALWQAEINLKNEANKAEADYYDLLLIIKTEEAEIKALESELLVINDKNLLNTLDLEEQIYEAKSKNGEIDINNIQEQIKTLEDLKKQQETILAAETDESLRVEEKTDILETQLEIEEHKKTLLEKQTEELEKQMDLMKEYVDLGVDLENIRVVKQLTANFAAQGYSGSALGAQLQDLGVSNKAISGRSLNIYGDINNTLNQATVNQSITSLNNIINSIGGV